jgi:hypothetical protein
LKSTNYSPKNWETFNPINEYFPRITGENTMAGIESAKYEIKLTENLKYLPFTMQNLNWKE